MLTLNLLFYITPLNKRKYVPTKLEIQLELIDKNKELIDYKSRCLSLWSLLHDVHTCGLLEQAKNPKMKKVAIKVKNILWWTANTQQEVIISTKHTSVEVPVVHEPPKGFWELRVHE